MSLFLFILILAALILVHELGHFAVAKFFKIKVEEFGIGFPPRLLKIKKGETLYSINLLFFGGFVKIFGEDHNEAAGNPRSFASKTRSVQAAVVAAGIVMNLLFAWGLLSVGYLVGIPTSAQHEGVGQVTNAKVLVVGLLPESPAAKSGVLPEDVVVGVATAGVALPTDLDAAEVRAFIKEHQEESIILSVMRAGEEKTFVVRAQEGLIEGRKALGVEIDDVGILKLPVHLALAQGAVLTYRMTISTTEGLGLFFYQIAKGVADFSSVAGPIGIAGIGAKAVSHGFSAAIILTALISINLAIINLLPIPGLDGGRLLIIAIESVIRRPVPQKLSLSITMVGLALLILLMLVVSYHDIARLVG
ncbi:MAG: site-2 protease [Parcubacteria group bacterium Gr01-1014_56]|nr:MAG: site-2 protease [Parcubacteria group bacterium Gr01-1014_56]